MFKWIEDAELNIKKSLVLHRNERVAIVIDQANDYYTTSPPVTFDLTLIAFQRVAKMKEAFPEIRKQVEAISRISLYIESLWFEEQDQDFVRLVTAYQVPLKLEEFWTSLVSDN